jgi:hypothetical protein
MSILADQAQRAHGPVLALVALALAASAMGGCGGSGGKRADTAAIPQPPLAELPGFVRRQLAPPNRRVDLRAPTFSHPTDVTNPLFPVSRQASVLLLGRLDGRPLRTEVTLLPETRGFEWRGQQVRTLVSQYVAYVGHEINQVALDYYAQADDGSVWYFGEDASNFRHGSIQQTHETWLEGRDGPPTMIMPAHPRLGDVYRVENLPGLVFEEVTVKAVDKTLRGPLGPVPGGMVIDELHADSKAKEVKSLAPAYGEFFTGGSNDFEALTLAIPTDALPGPVPPLIAEVAANAARASVAARSGRWSAAADAVARTRRAWGADRGPHFPKRIDRRMTAAVDALQRSVSARRLDKVTQSAMDVNQWSLDLQLRYRREPEIDRARFLLRTRQLGLDAKTGQLDAANGDFFVLDLIWDRIGNGIDPVTVTRVSGRLGEIQSAIEERDLPAARRAAAELGAVAAGFQTS